MEGVVHFYFYLRTKHTQFCVHVDSCFNWVTYVYTSALCTLNHNHLCVFVKPVAVLRFVIHSAPSLYLSHCCSPNPTCDFSRPISLTMSSVRMIWIIVVILLFCACSRYCVAAVQCIISLLRLPWWFAYLHTLYNANILYERRYPLCEHFTHHMPY